MPGLVPGTHAGTLRSDAGRVATFGLISSGMFHTDGVDTRDKRGHDAVQEPQTLSLWDVIQP
jgi:hypothetical protein